MDETTIAPGTSIGTVHLTVSDMTRALAFYQDTLGLQIIEKSSGGVVFAAGSHRLLHLVENPAASAAQGTTGLYHLAIVLPDRRSLARWLLRLVETERDVQGASDHGVSEALYLSDPDGNGIEVYADRLAQEWPRDDLGRLQMGTEELDVEDLIFELQEDGVEPWTGQPDGTRMGHIHLQVANLPETEYFYHQVLGFEIMQRYGSGAVFFSTGGYHHLIGANTWTSAGALPPPTDAIGLRWFEIILPSEEALQTALARAQAAAVSIEQHPEGWLVRDPSQNAMLLRCINK